MRFLLVYISVNLCAGTPALAGWRDWLGPYGPCPREMVEQLFAGGQSQNFETAGAFRRWINKLPGYHGLSIELVKRRYELLNSHPEVVALMKGMEVPAGVGNTTVQLSGGWGQDFLFVPSFPLWEAVHENLEPLIDRMGRELHLHPILVQQMFRGDHTSIPDSGWVIAEWKDDKGETKRATVKITFFDREMTPDGPFPRFSLESPLVNYFWASYRLPRQLSPFQAEVAAEGYFSLKSSLDYWGTLPLESLTNCLIPEHQAERYNLEQNPDYAGLFSDPFLLRHQLYMVNVIEAFKTKEVTKHLQALYEFRNKRIPPGALEVAELGRFNIPEEAPRSIKAHLFYGLSVLLRTRPINQLYLLSPKPLDPRGPGPHPEYEIFHVAPGYAWLRKAVEEVLREREAEHGPLPERPGSPPLDPLKRLYENLGFDTLGSPPYVFGLPNGAHVMHSPTNRFLSNIAEYQLTRSDYLSGEQAAVIRKLKETLGANE
ncbi:MAG: hypothetical protein KDD51_10975 [Bdellovibrionales bacterium]|nr:hypothetical protein [Bdellovibrionales bacterium]